MKTRSIEIYPQEIKVLYPKGIWKKVSWIEYFGGLKRYENGECYVFSFI